MIVIAENINSSIKRVEEAIVARDEPFIRDMARRLMDAGADYVEVNSGLRVYPEEEVEDLEWLAKIVQAETALPLCIDSAHAAAHEAILKFHQGRAILNSINGDQAPWPQILPLVQKHGCMVIGLLSDRKGIPRDPAGRLKIAERILEGVEAYGIPLDSVFLDPAVMPISVDTGNGKVVLETLRELKRCFPSVKAVAALSNISFGLPRRVVLNRAFVVLAREAGLDAAIVNPCDKHLMALEQASRALLNEDPFCQDYLRAFRAGKLQ